MNNLTQEQVSGLSDYDLNYGIANNLKLETFINLSGTTTRVGLLPLSKGFVDYCNSLDDLMPLVFEHEVSLMFRDHKSLSPRAYHKSIYTVNKSPQRALAECLFLVLQANNKE